MIVRVFLLICLFMTMSACLEETGNYAPVVEISTIESIPPKGAHRVGFDETLYSIAWRYGLDYRDLANINHIAPPYHINEGQNIYLVQKKPVIPIPPAQPIVPVTLPTPPKKPTLVRENVEKEPTVAVKQWYTPAYGPIIAKFGPLNKGINVGGQVGDPIFATATGKVVYSGRGLRGYGNLIIIKHNSAYLSAYAHNRKIFVKDGDRVTAGQKIAEMGDTGTTRVMLHFEIRKNGQPENPAMYLARKS